MDTTSAFPPPQNNNAMKDIIHSVDTLVPKVDSYYEKIVYINPVSGETSYDKPWFFRFNNWRMFWVTSQRYAMLQHFNCQLEDLQSGGFMDIDIMCRVQLIQGAEYKAVQLLQKEYDIDQGIKKRIGDWIRLFGSQHQHIVKNYFDLEKDLMKYVCDEAERHGLKIELFLSPYARLDPGEQILIKHTMRCQIKDWEIGLMCTLVMTLWDKRRFKMSRIEDIEKWMKEKIERIIQGVLIDKTISDLLQGYPSTEIQRRLESEAYEIGYRVKQLISIPLIDALELLKGFQFETDPEKGPSNIYYTKDVRVPVRLNISVKGKIDSFNDKVERYLKPGINLIQRMRDAVIDNTRFYLKGITPERFYFHFNSPYKEHGSLENELEKEIKKLLRDEFNVCEAVIHISPIDTKLTNRFNQLAGRFGFFACESISEQISYAIHFGVKGVDPAGWYVFKSRIFDEFDKEHLPVRDALKNTHTRRRVQAEEELLSIGSTMRHHIELMLNTETRPDLAQVRNGSISHPYTTTKIVKECFEAAALQIRKSHGLVIELISMERLSTQDDVEYKKQLADLIRTHKTNVSEQDIQKVKKEIQDSFETSESQEKHD